MPVANCWQETEEVRYALTFAVLGLDPLPGSSQEQAEPGRCRAQLQAAGAGLPASLMDSNCLQNFAKLFCKQ